MNNIRIEIEQAALGAAEISASAIELSGQESGHARRSFSFTPEFTGFNGHFPGFPILPAMLQTLMAQMLATQALPQGTRFSGVTRAKFIRQLGPDEEIDVEIAWRQKNAQWHCNATLRTQGQSASSMTLVFDEEVKPRG